MGPMARHSRALPSLSDIFAPLRNKRVDFLSHVVGLTKSPYPVKLKTTWKVQTMLPTADKSSQLAHLIKSWIEEKRGRNLYVLAKGSGLSYTNLRAIEAGKSDVTIDTALRLLSYVQPDEITTHSILRLYPDIAPMLGHLLQQKSKAGAYKLLSQKACRAAVEIYGRQGVAHEDLASILGAGTAVVVQELIDADLVTQDGNSYHPTHSSFHLNSADVLIPLLRLFLDNVNREGPLNMVEARFSGLKAEAAAEIQSVLEEARLRVNRIKQDPENSGDLNVAWGLVMTLF